jgi:hypothetical protein
MGISVVYLDKPSTEILQKVDELKSVRPLYFAQLLLDCIKSGWLIREMSHPNSSDHKVLYIEKWRGYCEVIIDDGWNSGNEVLSEIGTIISEEG